MYTDKYIMQYHKQPFIMKIYRRFKNDTKFQTYRTKKSNHLKNNRIRWKKQAKARKLDENNPRKSKIVNNYKVRENPW